MTSYFYRAARWALDNKNGNAVVVVSVVIFFVDAVVVVSVDAVVVFAVTS